MSSRLWRGISPPGPLDHRENPDRKDRRETVGLPGRLDHRDRREVPELLQLIAPKVNAQSLRSTVHLRKVVRLQKRLYPLLVSATEYGESALISSRGRTKL